MGLFTNASRYLLNVLFILTMLPALAQTANTGQGSRRFTFSANAHTIADIFQSITRQTGLKFDYKESDVRLQEKLSVNFTDITVDQALQYIFAGRNIAWKYRDNMVLIERSNKENGWAILPLRKPPQTASGIDISGEVYDISGNPLPGATVKIKGAEYGTIADEKGRFAMKHVHPDTALVISSLGFAPREVSVQGKRSFTVQLELNVKEMAQVEVVSSGYQDIPKERATGSFVRIGSPVLQQQVGINILKRLDGVASGVLFNINRSNSNPQNQTGISIRGLSTINGPLDPLIVLDNFIYEGSYDNINPNDVESITILKDAAAASIWGARAGNGVIVITTKKGLFNQKTKLEFNTTLISTAKPNLFYHQDMRAGDYIAVEEFLFNKGYFNAQINASDFPALIPSVEIFLKRKKGLITSQDSANQINALKQIDTREEYNRSFTGNDLTQQYALLVRGGTEKTAYLLSANHDRNKNYLGARYEKFNFRIENTLRPLKKLQANFSIYYTNSRGTSGAPELSRIRQISGRNVSYLRYQDDAGNALPLPVVSGGLSDAYTDTAGAGKLLNWKYYPLEDYKHERAITKLDELIGNAGLSYEIIQPLSVTLRYQFEKQTIHNESFYDPESYSARNYVNLFSQLDRTTGKVTYIVPPGGIMNTVNTELKAHNVRGQLNFNKAWGIHHLHGIAGGEIREVATTGNSGTLYGYQLSPLRFTPVDYATSYPTFVNGNFQQIAGSPTASSFNNRFVSLFSNLAYTLMNKYTVSASARKDGSNILGANTNDKWKPLWSAGLAWDIYRESFYHFRFIPHLKLRTTVGSSGNVDLSRSALPIAYFTPPTINTPYPAARIITLNNPELRWEQSRQLNIGVDFGLRNNIVSGSIEYYAKKGTDLYGPSPYDYTAWGGSREITRNVANMKGQGMDVYIRSLNINRRFKWETTFIFNYNISKTTAYYTQSAQTGNSLFGNGTGISPVIGKPLYAIAAYKWAGLDSLGNPQGILNGKKSTDYNAILADISRKGVESESAVFIGSGNPTIFGALNNAFSFKGIFVNFNLTYKFGYYFKRPSLQYTDLVISGIGRKEYEWRWQKPGDENITNVPSFQYPFNTNRDIFYKGSAINVLSGDHVRLQYINAGYSFEKGLKKIPFNQMQLYFNASNIGILWRANKEKLDPDWSLSVAPPRTFALGIRGSF